MNALTDVEQRVRAATFDEWTAGRDLRSVGTNYGSDELPFQGWQRFKEAFAPELIQRAVQASTIPVRRLLDPFGGSGTSALAAQFLGVLPETIEVNPYLADVIEAKLTFYDRRVLTSDVERYIYQLGALAHAGGDVPVARFLPPTFVELGVNNRWIYSRELYAFLQGAIDAASTASTAENQRFIKVAIGGSLVGLSNVRISGKGRRYRNQWVDRQATPETAASVISAALRRALRDVDQFNERSERRYHLRRGDARQLIAEVAPVDLIVFSPPYPNSFDYTDVYNIELWLLGYLSGMEDNRALRRSTLSSHVQIMREYAFAPETSPQLLDTLRELEEVSDKLWSPHLVSMVGAYFADMSRVMSASVHSMNAGAQMWMVVGDSRYAGVHVPVAEILIELSKPMGLKISSVEPFRSMRTSPQQGGQSSLPETLLVLENSHE